MNETRRIKDLLHEQGARIGKAASSPKRLELAELLRRQGCETVRLPEGGAEWGVAPARTDAR